MSTENAIKIMLWLLAAVLLFHFSIILKIIPYEITWAGKLKTDEEMYVFESVSIAINLLLFLILLIKGNYVKTFMSKKTVDLILWIFLVLFGLNTIGNLFAKTNLEKFFSILTLTFAILIWSVLRENKKLKNKNIDN